MPATCDRRRVQAQDCKQRGQCQNGHRSPELLGERQAMCIFDVWVFNSFAQSCRNTLLGQCYRHNELEKQRSYDERVREVEHGTFSPLVFFTAGGRGNTATVVYKRIASLIAGKQTKPYSKTLHWLRCRLSFSLLHSVVMCLRGSRSLVPNPAFSPSATMEVACAEGRVPSYI